MAPIPRSKSIVHLLPFAPVFRRTAVRSGVESEDRVDLAGWKLIESSCFQDVRLNKRTWETGTIPSKKKVAEQGIDERTEDPTIEIARSRRESKAKTTAMGAASRRCALRWVRLCEAFFRLPLDVLVAEPNWDDWQW